MKVKLQICPSLRKWPRSECIAITACLPFYKAASGQYVHRVRYASHYKMREFIGEGRWSAPEYSHTVFSAWCGQAAHHSTRWTRKKTVELMAEPPARAVHCAICEAKATGAGMTEAHEICGRFVMFRPRV